MLSNAIDSVFMSKGFRNKPCSFVGYGMSPTGGVRAVEHLIQAVNTLEATPLRNAVLIGFVAQAFGEDGEPTNPMTRLILDVMADDLAWWGNSLKTARAAGELPPSQLRLMKAMESLKGGK